MNKTELTNIIAEDTGLSKKSAKLVLESILKNVEKTLKKGERISLLGFGSWSLSNRGERQGRNPQTGDAIRIPAKIVVKFKAGTLLNRNDDGGTIGGGARIRIANEHSKGTTGTGARKTNKRKK
jgi:DNA-binding protein HU-beta